MYDIYGIMMYNRTKIYITHKCTLDKNVYYTNMYVIQKCALQCTMYTAQQ